MLRYLLTIFFVSASLTSVVFSEPPYTLVEDKAKTPILTPSFAQRQTLKMKLANGLDVYLISDPEAVKSAAALNVQAGSWEDPPNYPGLAHFLEHMLFLGTDKYPVESDYDRFIKEHDGKSNAYTASDHTLYAFSINQDAFEEALDRFSYFFKKPLFNPSGVNRELQAIDQEFAKNFSDDDIREHYVLKELSSPDHPFHRFSAGNSSTLSSVSRDVLKQWHQTHYSANLMQLVIYSSLPIDTLKKLVIEDFSGIPTTNRPAFHLDAPLLPKEVEGKLAHVVSLKDTRSLRLMWELPSRFAHMQDTRPEALVCYALGHEGPGSLLDLLKKENLAEELGCHGYRLGPDNSLFSLYLHLTEEGLQKIDLVIQRCFEAIRYLRRQGIPDYLFKEFQKMNAIRYQYQSREDPFEYVMKLGEWFSQEDLSTFPEQSSMVQRFDPQAIQDLLDNLTPARLFLTLLTKPETTDASSLRKEKWMGVPYTVESIPRQSIEQWKDATLSLDIHLPTPNPFIPNQLQLNTPSSIQPDKKRIPQPSVLLENEKGIIYYAQDEIFQAPETFWSFEIKTPAVERGDPTKVVLADLYVKCLQEALNPFSYSAKLADLDYEVRRVENGINLTVKGYSDNAEVLFDAILKRLKTCQPSQRLFDIFKDTLSRQYQNFLEESVLEQALELYQSIIYENFSTQKQKAKSIEQVTYAQLLDYMAHLFDKTYNAGLLYGNIKEAQARRLWDKLQSHLSSSPYPLEEHSVPKIAFFPPDKGPFFVRMTVKSPGNAVILGVEEAGFSFQSRAAQQILMQAMSGSFYSTLRTKQQTGYLVFAKAEEIEKHLFNFFAVQSNSHEARDLLARFELFIESFLQEMTSADLTEERFETIRRALLETLEQPPQSLSEMGNLLKTLAFKYNGSFDWISKRIQGFKELTYEHFLEMSAQSLGKTNKRRLAIFAEGPLPEDKEFKYAPLTDAEEMRKLSQYTTIKQTD